MDKTIKLANFTLEKLDLTKASHYKLVERLEEDKDKDFIAPNLAYFFSGEDSYVANIHGALPVGVIGKKSEVVDNTPEVFYMIDEIYKGWKYGSTLLDEYGCHLINEDEFSNIKLRMDKNNLASIKTALRVGYKKYDLGSNELTEEYRRYK